MNQESVLERKAFHLWVKGLFFGSTAICGVDHCSNAARCQSTFELQAYKARGCIKEVKLSAVLLNKRDDEIHVTRALFLICQKIGKAPTDKIVGMIPPI